MQKCIKMTTSILLVLSLAISFASCGINENKVAAVQSLIENLSDVSLENKNDVEAARHAYDALNNALQEQVSNAQMLLDAEEKIELLEEIAAIDFKNISCDNANKFEDTSFNTWMYDDDATSTLVLLFQLQGDADNWLDFDDLSLLDTFICRNKTDRRYDLLMLKKDKNSICFIQYWPESKKAQMGTKMLSTDLSKYAESLQKVGIIDSYKKLPVDNYMKILYMHY